MQFKEYFHPPAIAAGFASVLIGYSSSAVIIFQAAKAAGASAEQIGSWMVALGIGMGLTTFGLSWRYRMPIITAWSTPGAALLVTSLEGISLAQAIGATAPDPETQEILLNLAGVAAHSSERIAAPIACYLAGQAGIDPATALELARDVPAGDDDGDDDD